MSECSFLPDQDRNHIAKGRQIAEILDDPPESEAGPIAAALDSDTDATEPSPTTKVFRIQNQQSPYLDMLYFHHPVRITIDRGTTGNMIHQSVVQRLSRQKTVTAFADVGATVSPSNPFYPKLTPPCAISPSGRTSSQLNGPVPSTKSHSGARL